MAGFKSTTFLDSVHVEVQRCGSGMCGTVIWANEKAIADAKRGGTDNLMGLQLFRDFSMETPDHFSVAINSYAAQDLLEPLFSLHGLSTSCQAASDQPFCRRLGE